MTSALLAFTAVTWLLYGSIGALAATAYLVALRLNVRLYLERRSSRAGLLLHLLRLALLGALLVWTARRGATPLLATVAGFMLARLPLVARLLERPC